MTRIKRGKLKTKKRKKILKLAKGFRKPYSNKKRLAKEALLHSFKHSYLDRKKKKRVFRRLWQVRLNAYLREKGLKYSDFIYDLKKNNIEINRKILSELAQNKPEILAKIIEFVKV